MALAAVYDPVHGPGINLLMLNLLHPSLTVLQLQRCLTRSFACNELLRA